MRGIWYLFKDCTISVKDEYYEIFAGAKAFGESVFTKEELVILGGVYEKFKEFSTEELKVMSNKEAGWKNENQKKGFISYQKYGFELSINL